MIYTSLDLLGVELADQVAGWSTTAGGIALLTFLVGALIKWSSSAHNELRRDKEELREELQQMERDNARMRQAIISLLNTIDDRDTRTRVTNLMWPKSNGGDDGNGNPK